jgi:hypothetical protein
MNTNNIILILIIIIIVLFLWYILNNNTLENFITQNSSDENIYGNILAYEEPATLSFNKLFKKIYRITAIYVECESNYTVKLNGSYISYNDNIKLTGNKYYDISDLNIKTKEISFLSSGDDNITKIIVYGLNTYNLKGFEIYDSTNLLIDNNISTDNQQILFKNNEDYLLEYLQLPDSFASNNFLIKYKNKFEQEFKTYYSNILDFDNYYNLKSSKIYFDKPLLANSIQFNLEDGNIISTNLNNVKVYGKYATDNDIKTLQLETLIQNEEGMETSSEKCPSMNEIINKQKLINDLCNSMSEKDKIRGQQTYYEKTKKYLSKLKQQESQIQILKLQLETLLKDNKNTINAEFKEKASSIQGLVDDISTNNLFEQVYINYEKPITTQPVTTS